MPTQTLENAPMKELDEWDDFVATRYKQGKTEEEFRNYKPDANPGVTEFYRLNHLHQTLDFVLQKKAQYGALQKGSEEHLGPSRIFEHAGGR